MALSFACARTRRTNSLVSSGSLSLGTSFASAMKSAASGRYRMAQRAAAARRMSETQRAVLRATLLVEHSCPTAASMVS